MTELAPTQGDLLTQLKTHVERAKAKKLQPVAEFYADWCPPCREFHKNLEDPALADALRGTYLVKLNMDDWHDHLKNTGFDVRTIPRFFLLGDDGRASGKMLDGDQWGRRPTPQTMAAALNKLLGR
jgi:thioredoxin-like negative regulator of GroEL